jgi:hypothetical protein
MGIYDRDYYRERKATSKRSLFKVAYWVMVGLFVLAFVVYALAVFSR